VNVGAEVSGKILEVRVDEGMRVARGDYARCIDDTEYALQLLQAEAAWHLESAYQALRRRIAAGRCDSGKAATKLHSRMRRE